MSMQDYGRGGPRQVFILGGQSNMDGRGDAALLVDELREFAQPFPAVSLVYANGSTVIAPEPQPLAPGFAVPPGNPPTPRFGPELSFGRRISAALPEKKILLIKCSKGGTSLHKDWNPHDPASLYHAMAKLVRQSLEKLIARGGTFTLRGFAWHQGESDASLPPGEYSKLFAAFAARLRHDLAAPTLPIVAGEVLDDGSRATVVAELRSLPQKLSQCACVSVDGLTSHDAATHFDTPSVIKLGQRYAERMLKLLGHEPAAG